MAWVLCDLLHSYLVMVKFLTNRLDIIQTLMKFIVSTNTGQIHVETDQL